MVTDGFYCYEIFTCKLFDLKIYYYNQIFLYVHVFENVNA